MAESKIKLMMGVFLLFGGFALMVQEIVGAPYIGLIIMAVGFYLIISDIK